METYGFILRGTTRISKFLGMGKLPATKSIRPELSHACRYRNCQAFDLLSPGVATRGRAARRAARPDGRSDALCAQCRGFWRGRTVRIPLPGDLRRRTHLSDAGRRPAPGYCLLSAGRHFWR